MKTYLSPEKIAKQRDCTLDELISEAVFDGSCPACCIHDCEVEPDGKCPHGNPSILMALTIY